MLRMFSLIVVFTLTAVFTTDAIAAENKKHIVIVAGTKSHGYGSHEFNAGCQLLAAELNRSMKDDVRTTVHLNGWPKDPKAFDDADAIILYMDGGGRHPILKHLKAVGKHMDRGVGLMCMHYAVEVPKGEAGRAFQKWIGGYYETHWSINPHWKAKAILNSKHPISNGVKPFEVHDEWYYNMRFREGMKGVINVLQAVPDDEARSGSTSWPRGPKEHIVKASGRKETLTWAVERMEGGASKGRGVGFTGGHFHWNWAEPNYRKMVLNAIVWVAGDNVPKDGVPVSRLSMEDMKANQDFKPNPKKANLEKIAKDVEAWQKDLK